MPYPIGVVDGISPGIAKKLLAAKIRTTTKLLRAAGSPQGRKLLAEKTGLDAAMILRCANMADRMRIKGVGEDYAELLEAAGVFTVKELKYRNPANLAKAMAKANVERKLVQLPPSEKAVVRWIEHARKLQLKITY
jgi:predicted flap endonuclease-1-like 5' DNA nuclease